MKKFLIIFFAFAALNLCSQDLQNAGIMQAMRDEMRRSLVGLGGKEMPKPYFMVYKVLPVSGYAATANQGALTETWQISAINVLVALRLGSAKEDNSFFVSTTYPTADRQSPDFSYDAIRAALWDETDRAYKNAQNALAKKRAYKQNKKIDGDYPDFSPAPAAKGALAEPAFAAFPSARWESLAKRMSAQGNLKELNSFKAAVSDSYRPVYFLSSEGAQYIKPYRYLRISLSATAKTENGFEFTESKNLIYADLKDVPDDAELIKQAGDFAAAAAALTKAKKAEPFIGPVMLEGGAAAGFLDDVFTRAVNEPRPVHYSSGNPTHGEFAQKLGLKIMPAWFDVFDDPAAKTFNNKTLAGFYEIDDEGVAARRLHLVDGGKLAAQPSTRSPIKGQPVSNGHAVLARRQDFAQGRARSLFFIPRESIPAAQFKDKFLEYCRQEGLNYCYIVRGNTAGSSFSAYKVDAKTGEETPVYGAGFKDMSTRALRDIKFAADDLEAYNLDAELSVVAPSLILGEAEIIPTKKLPDSPPLVPKP
ncbi:MAG: hypothetical protein LBL61_05490 [Elusimicrobiota bacterium]|jgi:hypothetical protein|nr:hypothetical protein [Elusimicrobiota bacterium]